MTLRTSSSLAHATLTFIAFIAFIATIASATSACGEGVRISLQLSTAQNGEPEADGSELRSLTVLIDNGEVNDRESFALNRDEQVLVPQMSVDKTKPFFMEVWGCERDTCELEDVRLRGCTVQQLDVRNQANETFVVQMTMYDFRDDTLRLCPAIGG